MRATGKALYHEMAYEGGGKGMCQRRQFHSDSFFIVHHEKTLGEGGELQKTIQKSSSKISEQKVNDVPSNSQMGRNPRFM